MSEDLVTQLVATWRTHNAIQLFLIQHIPAAGFAAVPHASRGRTVAAQLAHCHAVRLGWVHYCETGERPAKGDTLAHEAPSRTRLAKAFRESGKVVEGFLARALRGEAKVRMHGRSPVRFLGYLVSHESHHRGQIALALKQNGLRLPTKVATDGLWGAWIYGRWG